MSESSKLSDNKTKPVKEQKSLKKNFIMNALLTMSAFIFPLITFPYVSRVLLPEGTGKVNTAISFISYFSMIAQLGIPTYGIRVCAKVRDNKEKLTRTAHELLVINIAMSIISYAAFIICLFTVPKVRSEKLLYLVISSSIFLSSLGMEWLYKALEQYTYITVRSVIFKFISFISMFLLVKEYDDYVIYGGVAIFAASASNIFNLINVHKYIGLKPVGNYNFRQHFKAVGVFFAMSCAATIYTHLDTVMLGFMTTDADCGYYTAAVKIKTILVSVVTSLGAVLLPRASYYVQNQMMEEFRRITAKALNFVLIISVPLTLYFMIFAKPGIFFLSGKAYEGGIVPMQIIMPTLILIGITNILGIQILVPTGREKFVLYSEIVGAVVDLIINALLIPNMRSSGAAIGTLAAETAVLMVQGIVLIPEIKESIKAVKFYKILISVILASAASVWIMFVEIRSSFVILAVSACCFFAVYFVALIILKEKLVFELFLQIFGKIKRKTGIQ